jgi:hypothetical protein
VFIIGRGKQRLTRSNLTPATQQRQELEEERCGSGDAHADAYVALRG